MADTPSSPALSRRVLIGAGLATLPLAAPPSIAWAARGKVITILGDSITAGLGLPGRDALPNQLHLALEKLGVPNLVRGAAISGDTTADGLARMDFSIRPDSSVVLVALGGNDLLQGVDTQVVRANLDKILDKLAARHKAAVLCGIKAPPEIGAGYARDFNAVFPQAAKAHHVPLYPDLLAGVERNRMLNQGDGIHPNEQGVRIIARRLAPLVAQVVRKLP